MRFLEFMFSSFWIWFGMMVALAVFMSGVAEIIRAIRGKRLRRRQA